MKNRLDPESVYRQLAALVGKSPSLSSNTYLNDESQRWLARSCALLRASGYEREAESIEYCTDVMLGTVNHSAGVTRIKAMVYRVWAQTELEAPVSLQGSFIPAGGSFDAFSAVGKVLSQASTDVLLVDPYMDDKILTDFVPLAAEGVSIPLLSDEATYKSILGSAVARWKTQYGRGRPVEARLSHPKALHDRSIILDRKKAWILTQSFKDLAARSPATLSLLDADSASLKIGAYEDIWSKSRVI
jgi:hypothetical protein